MNGWQAAVGWSAGARGAVECTRIHMHWDARRTQGSSHQGLPGAALEPTVDNNREAVERSSLIKLLSDLDVVLWEGGVCWSL